MQNQEFYTYRRHPLLDRAFLIYRQEKGGEAQPVGDYTVLDDGEALDLTERKLIRLVGTLNGQNDMTPLAKETGARLLFHCKERQLDDPRQQIVFYTYNGEGVSKENAIMTLEGIEHEA